MFLAKYLFDWQLSVVVAVSKSSLFVLLARCIPIKKKVILKINNR